MKINYSNLQKSNFCIIIKSIFIYKIITIKLNIHYIFFLCTFINFIFKITNIIKFNIYKNKFFYTNNFRLWKGKENKKK